MNPTAVPLFNSQTPAAPAGYQNGAFQTNGGTPVQMITVNLPNTGGAAVKTGSYTIAASDCGLLIVYNSTAAGTFTLPSAIPFARWQVSVQNIGAGALSLAPGGSLQLDGATASLTLPQGQGVSIHTDGTNYFTERGTVAGPYRPYHLLSFVPGQPLGGEIVLQWTCPGDLPNGVAFAANFGGYASGYLQTAPASTATYTLRKVPAGSGPGTVGTTIGNISISTAGAFTFTLTATSFAVGDTLTATAPTAQDTSLSGVGFTLPGGR